MDIDIGGNIRGSSIVPKGNTISLIWHTQDYTKEKDHALSSSR